MRLAIDVTLAYNIDGDADVLLLVEAAAMADQRLVRQDLRVFSDNPITAQPGLDGVGQRCWAQGSNHLRAEYRAIVDIDRPAHDIATLKPTAPHDLPAETVPYLLPSRYCESERFQGFVERDFVGLSGGALAAALRDWVRNNLDYAAGASDGSTTALETFASRSGVCRDYAHLLVALARAGGIPARCVAAYAPGVDPPDFHAVTELWLDCGWHLVDATGMARADEIARVAVGRDATDIAFMTVFGTAQLVEQRVVVSRLDLPEGTSFALRSFDNRAGEKPMSDQKPIDRPAAAPGDPEEAEHIHHPRQEAGQDGSIAERLEKNPSSEEARLDNALDESMDASDPPAATQPVHQHEPPASSGFDAEAEARRKKG